MNYAGDRSALVSGIQREYLRKKHYTDHLDQFLEDI